MFQVGPFLFFEATSPSVSIYGFSFECSPPSLSSRSPHIDSLTRRRGIAIREAAHSRLRVGRAPLT